MTATKHKINSEQSTALSARGMKSTHARKEILDYLTASKRPVSADEIQAFLLRQSCDTNKATIYRTLESFVAVGLITRLEFGEGKYRYELNTDDHHHLVCERCGS